jgi:hypothetical protein
MNLAIMCLRSANRSWWLASIATTETDRAWWLADSRAWMTLARRASELES